LNDASWLQIESYAAKARAGTQDSRSKFQVWALLACSSVHLRLTSDSASAFEQTKPNSAGDQMAHPDFVNCFLLARFLHFALGLDLAQHLEHLFVMAHQALFINGMGMGAPFPNFQNFEFPMFLQHASLFFRPFLIVARGLVLKPND